ncbi:MAG: hypothetical protein HOQ29_01430 [Acidobacteria bacterium]|nr:hypothetical protein [Acidobacteriota bacterium]
MTSAHFIFIPAVLLVGIVIGWILGGRAAQDAFAAEMRRREERAQRERTKSMERTDLTTEQRSNEGTKHR